MDIEKIADDIGISVDAYKKLCSTFLKAGKEDLQHLREAIEANNQTDCSQYAHHIKGSATNMDFGALAEHAKTIELSAKENKMEGLMDEFLALEKEFNTIESELQQCL